MAIAKDIAIHSSDGIDNCEDYITNKEKTSVSHNKSDEEIDELSSIENVYSYAANSEKTTFVMDGDEELLVSGISCAPETASVQFQMDRDRYLRGKGGERVYGKKMDPTTGEKTRDKEAIVAYHLIQSFPAIAGLDPRLAHQMGREFAERAFAGHRGIVATHMNTDHIHNHILINAYSMEEFLKIKMDMAQRRAYRTINDEISLEFGLPILLEKSLAHKTLSFIEMDAKKHGESWKQAVKNDINDALEYCSSWEEFKDAMISNGYVVKEKNGKVSYSMYGDSVRTIRDTTLGEQYTKASIMKQYGEIVPEEEQEHKPEVSAEPKLTDSIRKAEREHKRSSVYVSRMSATGRRRSKLEIILIKAIKLVKKFMDSFRDEEAANRSMSNPVHAKAEVKLAALESALQMVEELGLKDRGDLKGMMNNVGMSLSVEKRELERLEKNASFSTQMLQGISELKKLEDDPVIKVLNKELLHIPSYSKEEVEKNQASMMPATPKQRKELFKLIDDNPEWKVDRKYDEMTYDQARDVIAFLRGKTSVRPDIVLTIDEHEQKKLEKKYKVVLEKSNSGLRSKYGIEAATPALISKVEELSKEHGFEVNVKKLSMYDAIKIADYYAENPIKLPYSPSRDSEPARESTKAQIIELMDLKKVDMDIPFDSLTQEDANKFYTYLLNKGEIPEILKPKKDDGLKEFNDYLISLPEDQKAIVFKYRNLLDELASFGITIDEVPELEAKFKEISEQLAEQQVTVEDLGTQYKELSKLNYTINLAETKAFTHGSLFTKAEIEEAEVEKSEEEVTKEDDKIQKEAENKRNEEKDRKKRAFFEGIAGGFFDRI